MAQAAEPAPRRIGRPPRLSRDRIVQVASEIDPADLTLTAVADRLGAARNAVAYHVGSREDLLALVIERRLATRLADLHVPLDDWRAAVRTASHGMLDALLEEGPAALAVTRAPLPGVIGPSEDLLKALTKAGFTTHDAGRTLGMLAELVYAAARNSLDAGAASTTAAALVEVIESRADAYPTFAEALDQRWEPREQLNFSLNVVILGLERVLDD
ncbi:TetR/AcrR family transcriptional regulator [Demequina salsinemoris]|uniref:TetR/AcrR family transcriptional regulator n=1 Tax=Demequina salsinemoris TaxID=577470 RepID=UPI000783B0A2|nr:TetR/AcrR family transcriptional regulator C-terminal domain-containing protein [Demequina salsinemoris]